jgi:RNA polymerase sigma-70 factor, ECF subfamily
MADSIIGFGFGCDDTGIPSRPADPCADDAPLLLALKANQESAYETLIARFQQPVYNLVLRLLNDPADASDAVQEVFLKVFRNVEAFRGQSSLKTWIYRIALNEAYNHRRWFSRHRKQEVGLEAEEEGSRNWIDSICDPARDPYELTLNEERHQLIEEALREINPAFRAAVVLRDLEELSYEEIAEVMQVSLGTVKSRILRGREALRRVLVSRMDEATAAARNPQSNVGWMQETVK